MELTENLLFVMEYSDIESILRCRYCLLTIVKFFEENYCCQYESEPLHCFCVRHQVGTGFGEREAAKTAIRGKADRRRGEITKRYLPGELTTQSGWGPFNVWDLSRSVQISRLTRNWRTRQLVSSGLHHGVCNVLCHNDCILVTSTLTTEQRITSRS